MGLKHSPYACDEAIGEQAIRTDQFATKLTRRWLPMGCIMREHWSARRFHWDVKLRTAGNNGSGTANTSSRTQSWGVLQVHDDRLLSIPTWLLMLSKSLLKCTSPEIKEDRVKHKKDSSSFKMKILLSRSVEVTKVQRVIITVLTPSFQCHTVHENQVYSTFTYRCAFLCLFI